MYIDLEYAGSLRKCSLTFSGCEYFIISLEGDVAKVGKSMFFSDSWR